MKPGYLLLAVLPLVFLASCISDDNRCGPGQTYVTDDEDSAKYYCRSDEVFDGGTEPDGGNGGSGEDGFGEACVFQEGQCEGYEADFCFSPQEEGATGYCTYRDCVLDPSDCPSGYTCCDFVYVPMQFCIRDADFQGRGFCK